MSIRNVPGEDQVAIGGENGVQVLPNTSVAVKAGPGRLCHVALNVAGTGAGDVQFIDGPSVAASGTVIARLAATTGALPATGAPIQFDLPFYQGLVIVNPTNGPTMYVTFD